MKHYKWKTKGQTLLWLQKQVTKSQVPSLMIFTHEKWTKNKKIILHSIKNKKPIVALCISPTLIAKSLEGTEYHPNLTLGSVNESSKYNISEINEAISLVGAIPNNSSIKEICVDEKHKIITAPCYMMDVDIDEIYFNAKMAIDRLAKFLS